MSLRSRLLWMLCLAAVAMAAMGLGAWWALDRLELALDIAWSSSEQQAEVERLSAEVEDTTDSLGAFLAGDAAARPRWESHRQSCERILERLCQQGRTERQRQRVEELVHQLHRFDLVAQRSLFLRKKGEEGQSARLLRTWLDEQLLPELEAEVLGLTQDSRAELVEARSAAVRRARWFKRGMVAAFCLLAVAGLAMGVLMRRWIVRPVRSLLAASEAVGRGEWQGRLDVVGPREFQSLAVAFEDMAQSIEEHQVDLVQKERMAAVGELTASVAHNVRNPLASIRAVAQTAQYDVPESEAVYSSLRTIVQSVDRADRWLRELLGVFRSTPLERREESLAGMLARVADAVDWLAQQKGVKLVRDWSADLPCGDFDRSKIEQSLVALCTNAIEATPAEASVRLGGQLMKYRPGWVLLEVEDEGPGMEDQVAKQIFSPCFSTKKSGAGVGLHLAQRVVFGHGGRIRVRTAPGAGCHMLVEIPIHENHGGDGDGHHPDS